MDNSQRWEDELGSDRFCIQPHVGSLAGAVFRVIQSGGTVSYLALEVVEPQNFGKPLKLGRHLITQYCRIGPPMHDMRYEGTLILRHACAVTDHGFIEPTGERRLE